MVDIMPDCSVTPEQIVTYFSRFITNIEELKSLIRKMPIGGVINYRGINIHRLNTRRYFCSKY
jgi:hypothetical protein